ncbi:MAG: Ig-like domain-containing protein [Ignavibacteriales bacterium]|nr:Ig-like domain-containing protein [Ignavibacteriales bacterium]MCF8438150.1 Ig-like domain-containing protein [Ignavibacteriales bacterium]
MFRITVNGEKLNNIKLLIIVLTFFLIQGCAHQLPPGGGEVDKIPPEIIVTYPENGATFFSEDYISLEFSEYVDKRSVKESVFISPEIDGELEYDWSGTTLTISFPGRLSDSTTYTVSIGTDVIDLNNKNRMAESYSLVFSTGSRIDKGQISGRVFTAKPSGYLVGAYRILSDSLDPRIKKPDYLSQSGKDGQFLLKGISPGKYRVFAFLDDFKDKFYDPEQDSYAAPFTDIALSITDTLFSDLIFIPQREDTTAPSVVSITMTDRHHFLVEANEFLDSSKLNTSMFIIYDSLSNKRIVPDKLFKGNARAKSFFLTSSDTAKPEGDLFIISKGLCDLSGNLSADEKTPVTYNEKPDTTGLKILKFEGMSKQNIIPFREPVFNLFFNDAPDVFPREDFFKFVSASGKIIQTEFNMLDDASLELKVLDKLEQRKNYSLSFDPSLLSDLAGNFGDSLLTYNFITDSEIDYSGLSGAVRTDVAGKYILKLQYLDEKNKEISTNTETGQFEFRQLKPGNYFLWAFYDRDNNGQFNYGKVFPFEASEKIVIFPDTIKVRARWPVGDLDLEFRSQSSEAEQP